MVSPSSIEIREFESHTVTCTAVANPSPAPGDYKWFNPKGYLNSYSSELTITRATKEDAGQYICHVSVTSDEYGLQLNGTSHTMVTVFCKFIILNLIYYTDLVIVDKDLAIGIQGAANILNSSSVAYGMGFICNMKIVNELFRSTHTKK